MTADSADECACEVDTDQYGYYPRSCRMCGDTWWSNHCEHDTIQRGCPGCGWREPGERSAMEVLFDRIRPTDQRGTP